MRYIIQFPNAKTRSLKPQRSTITNSIKIRIKQLYNRFNMSINISDYGYAFYIANIFVKSYSDRCSFKDYVKHLLNRLRNRKYHNSVNFLHHTSNTRVDIDNINSVHEHRSTPRLHLNPLVSAPAAHLAHVFAHPPRLGRRCKPRRSRMHRSNWNKCALLDVKIDLDLDAREVMLYDFV